MKNLTRGEDEIMQENMITPTAVLPEPLMKYQNMCGNINHCCIITSLHFHSQQIQKRKKLSNILHKLCLLIFNQMTFDFSVQELFHASQYSERFEKELFFIKRELNYKISSCSWEFLTEHRLFSE